MENQTILQGTDIDLVKKTVIVRKYKDGSADGFNGKSYRLYAFGEKAFAVHEDDSFHQDFADGNIQRMLITVSPEGWSLSNHVTWTRANATKRNQAIHDSITVENFKVNFVPSNEIIA